MTDLTPNDLSHLSREGQLSDCVSHWLPAHALPLPEQDEAFWALCPQGEHAPGPEPLSPAAQAVLDAATPALNNLDACGFNHQRYDRKALAAALRAAAIYCTRERRILMTIADELENHQ